MKARATSRRAKGAQAEAEVMTLTQLLDFLGIHNTSGAALSEATYYACIKVLSESIGKLPLKILQYTPEGGVRVAREHRYYTMLNERPNRHMTASTFWGGMEAWRDHAGNAYALIDESDPRRPQLWPVDPSTVQVWYDDACELADAPDVYYLVSTKQGRKVYSSEELLHLKAHLTRDGLVGISVQEQLAATVQSGVKAQSLVNSMYDSGMTSKAVLQYTGSINDANVKTLVAEVGKYIKGEGKAGADKLIPLPQGFGLTPLTMKLADSQFLEVKQYTALQIASAFGVKPYQVGDYTKSSYASAEAQQLSFLVDTLLYIVKQYEEELSYKLLTDKERAKGYHIKFNTGVLLRADQQTQITTLSTAVAGFLMTPNEAREKLDLPAKDGGDRLIGNGSTVPLEQLGIQWQAPAEEPQEEPEEEKPAEGTEDKPPEEKPEGPQEEPQEEAKSAPTASKRKRSANKTTQERRKKSG
jgi:HK97 family phage portal protein